MNRNIRRYRKSVKRGGIRQQRREHDNAVTSARRFLMLLMAVLAQKGGEVVVTQGTIDQVGFALKDMSVSVVPNPANAKEFIVRLVEGTEDEKVAPAENPDATLEGDPVPRHTSDLEIHRLADDGGPAGDEHVAESL